MEEFIFSNGDVEMYDDEEKKKKNKKKTLKKVIK